MFSFMAKFEELQKNLAPLQEIATQMYPYTTEYYVLRFWHENGPREKNLP